MHVEIHHGDAVKTVHLQRVARGDGHIGEQAEPHRPDLFGVVSGRAGGDEGVPGPPLDHGIDGGDTSAHTAQRGLPRAGAGPCVGVQPLHPRFGNAAAHAVDVDLRVPQQQRCLIRHRRDDPGQAVEFGGRKRLVDLFQPFDPFGVARWRQVVQPRGVLDKKGHGSAFRINPVPACSPPRARSANSAAVSDPARSCGAGG